MDNINSSSSSVLRIIPVYCTAQDSVSSVSYSCTGGIIPALTGLGGEWPGNDHERLAPIVQYSIVQWRMRNARRHDMAGRTYCSARACVQLLSL